MQRLEVSLEPAGALTQEAAHVGHALLVNGGRGPELVGPAGGVEPDPQVEVLGQRPGPGPGPQGVECAEADELGVAPHADAADPAPASLEDLSEDDELHVLHAGEQGAEAVVDAHPHLDSTDLLRGEGLAHLPDGVGVEPAVGVHDSYDDSRGGHRGAPGAHDRQRVVEGLPLAQAGVGRTTANHLDALVAGLGGHLGGVVVGAVVDDHDAQAGVRDGGEPPDAGADDRRLVEAGHEDDDEQRRIRMRGTAVPWGPARGDEHEEGVGQGDCDHPQGSPPTDAVEDSQEARGIEAHGQERGLRHHHARRLIRPLRCCA